MIRHCLHSAFLLTLFSQLVSADVQVFILAGDSHAVGTTSDAVDLPSKLQQPQSDVLFWYDEHFIVDSLFGLPMVTRQRFLEDRYLRPQEGTSAWVELRPQEEFEGRIAFDKANFGLTGADIVVGHGPEITLGRSLADATDDEIAIIKFAWGGSRLGSDTSMDWNVNSENELFDWMIDEVNLAMSVLQPDKSSRIAGVFWAQDTDSFNFTGALLDSYEQNLVDLIESTRSEWGENLPFVLLEINDGMIASGFVSEQRLGSFRAAQEAIASQDMSTLLVRMNDVALSSDSIHYSSAGSQIIGERMATAYLDAFAVILGDFNGNRVLDADDVNQLNTEITSREGDPRFDLTGDGLVDEADLENWVKELRVTWFGDSNLDGEFNSGDLVALFTAGEYEDGMPENSTWTTGDFNADAEFDSGDLVAAFTDGGYEQGPPVPERALPEPTSVMMLITALICIAAVSRTRRSRV